MSEAPYFDGTQPCAKYDFNYFFPENLVEHDLLTAEIKVICAPCPFLKPCLEYAIKNEEYGFWAGTSHSERKELRKKIDLPVRLRTRRPH